MDQVPPQQPQQPEPEAQPPSQPPLQPGPALQAQPDVPFPPPQPPFHSLPPQPQGSQPPAPLPAQPGYPAYAPSQPYPPQPMQLPYPPAGQPYQPIYPPQPMQPPYPQPYPTQPPYAPAQPPYQALPPQAYRPPAQPPYPPQQQVAPSPAPSPMTPPPNAGRRQETTPRSFRNVFRVATAASITSTVLFVVYVLSPRATPAQNSHAHTLFVAGLVDLAVAELCQILGILILIGHWASHFNTEKRLREVLILIVSLIPFMVIVIFTYTAITYLRARRQDPASDETAQAKQELKEQTTNMLIDAGSNRSSGMASAQASPAPISAARPTMRETVRRVIGPSTAQSFSEVGNGLVTLTMFALVFATVATLGAATPLNRLVSRSLPGASGSHSPAGTITTLTLPDGTTIPGGIAAGPDGNVWFTEDSEVARITPNGAVTAFPITSSAQPQGITTGPDGNLWFTESSANLGSFIGQMTPTGTVTEFPIPTSNLDTPAGIVAGPDGNLWFTAILGNYIGQITPSGQVTKFPLPSKDSAPNAIVAGPDGNLWFTARSASELDVGTVGRITPSGQITEFPNSGGVFNAILGDSLGIETGGGISYIAVGSDHNLWYTGGNAIERITTSGQVTSFPLPNKDNAVTTLTEGSDGNIWFGTCTPNNAASSGCIDAVIGRITPSGTITSYPLQVGDVAESMTTGPDKNLWVTEPFSNQLLRVSVGVGVSTAQATLPPAPPTATNSPTGNIVSFPLTTATDSPTGIITGPDGNLWFGECAPIQGAQVCNNGKIGRITPAGQITEFPLPVTNSDPVDITAGPDGNLWFGDQDNAGVLGTLTNRIGRITPAGQITEFNLKTGETPYDITAGPDGNLWFTEDGEVGRITPTGQITQFPLPTSGHVFGIVAGPDGNLWFTETTAQKIGRITPKGQLTEFPVPTSPPVAITAGKDGNLWFTEINGTAASITPAGKITENTTVVGNTDIITGPDGNFWLANDGEVLRLTPGGQSMTFSLSDSNAECQSITTGPDGNLWFTTFSTASRTGSIEHLTPP